MPRPRMVAALVCAAAALVACGGDSGSDRQPESGTARYRAEAAAVLEPLYDQVQPVLNALVVLEQPRPGQRGSAAPFFDVAIGGQVLPAVQALQGRVDALQPTEELAEADAAFKKAHGRLVASLGPVLGAPKTPNPGETLNSVQNAMEVALVDLDAAVQQIYGDARRPAVPSSRIASSGGGRPPVSRSAVVVRASQICDSLMRGLDDAEKIDRDLETPAALLAAAKAVGAAAKALGELPVPAADRGRLAAATQGLTPVVDLPARISDLLAATAQGRQPTQAQGGELDRDSRLLSAAATTLGGYGSRTCERQLVRAAM